MLCLLGVLLAAPVLPGAAQAKCFPAYGNWCGAAYPPPGANPPPMDVYDNACRNHDLCYASPTPRGACDTAFAAELRELAARTGWLPRPLQWAVGMIRMKEGGGPWDLPLPHPGDMLGAMAMMGADCGY